MNGLRLPALLPVFVFLAWGCHSGKQAVGQPGVDDAQAQKGDSLLAGIRRGACFGKCPQYEAMIYQSGYATYTGEQNVTRTGKWQAWMDKAQLSAVESLLEESGTERWDSVYVNKYLADFPVLFLWVRQQGGSRRIMVNHEAPPEEITGFAKGLDQLLSGLDWRKVNAPRDPGE